MSTDKKDEKKYTVECQVVVRKSNIENAGRGVFLTKPISPGLFVCYYDGYVKPERSLASVECDYQLEDVIGYIKPKTELGVGQIINDMNGFDTSGFPEKKDMNTQLSFLAGCVFNYTLSSRKCNVAAVTSNEYKNPLISIKNINAGEELYFSYGLGYWISKLCRNKTSSVELTRALLMIKCVYDAHYDDHEVYLEKILKEFAKNMLDEVKINQWFITMLGCLVVGKSSAIIKSLPILTDQQIQDAKNNKDGVYRFSLTQESKLKYDEKTYQLLKDSYVEFRRAI